MSHLLAIVYDGPDPARRSVDRLHDATRAGPVEIAELVVAVRRPSGEVVLDRSVDAAAGRVSGVAFWESLVGFVFLNPLIGTAAGAAAGALCGWLADHGLDDDFIRRLNLSVVPGKAVLFVLTRHSAIDRVVPLLGGEHGEVLHASLAGDVDALLADALTAARERAAAVFDLPRP